MTLIIEYKKEKGDEQLLKPAEILKNGGTVVFPTETVYGLGANALSEEAAMKIYAAKGRPSDNPLIVHIHDQSILESLVESVPKIAVELMEAFWPGPLTLVFKKSGKVSDIVSGGLGTVAVRMPSDKVALKLIELAGVPVAAPSANVSGRPSPTRPEHVISQLSGRVDAIVTEGDAKHGLESTVLDVSSGQAVLLRPGSVTVNQIEGVIGTISLDPTLLDKMDHMVPKAPGMKYRHYAPDAQVYVLDEGLDESRCRQLASEFESEGKKVRLILESDAEILGKNLFAWLIAADNSGVDVVLIKAVSTDGVGLAVMNRLLKSAGHRVLL
ncbi:MULTISPECIES: L-threonylcarbamoyladenylate synthase [unclassified Fusibacter]|uniref:L-threonylcarbamoyladenylate synthase n=1 Tax=unclassified Fusibacter TaxID=2624464 RepID=UPI0010122556|nr:MULTISPECIES: L-threonylcarbamoyladenylate synthase [unclassified Fusibacter]MCK8059875.1 L-threonylcarbamoyladenylate synthase [Fusibacter sp. A2]NPE21677.1 threonylcarbamoyl-AMP synthase [Fusibacter sp. A1]RXV62080.1 threonylcarbamoyl-AMP synthase [Fusibacter sp. A1]